MILARFCLAALVLLPQEAEVRELISKLDDDSIQVRTDAAAELVRLGKTALPEIQKAHDASSGERQERLAEILKKIAERDRLSALLRPARRLTVEASDLPVRQVLESFVKQAGSTLDLREAPAGERVTLSAKGVTYWEGLDALCKASGKVMYDLGSSAKSAIRPGPYAPLPRKFSGPFAVLLETIDINSSGSFGHPDRYDEMQLHFRVAWENGTHPSFVRLFLLGLTDDIGTDLRPGEDEAATEAQTNVQEGRVSTGAAIVTPRLPDPKARKLARVRVEVELGFVLSYGGVSFKDPCATGATALECPQFAATLLTATRDQGRLTARLKVEPRAAAVQAITVESLVLRLRDGKTPAGQLMESSSDGMSITYGVSWDIGDKGEPAELSVRTPLEVHVERIPVEFTDVSLE